MDSMSTDTFAGSIVSPVVIPSSQSQPKPSPAAPEMVVRGSV